MVPHPPLDPEQGLVQIASVEAVRTGCALGPFRQQAVAHGPQAQPGVPERERHARAEQGLPTSASRAEDEFPWQEQARTQDAPPWRKR